MTFKIVQFVLGAAIVVTGPGHLKTLTCHRVGTCDLVMAQYGEGAEEASVDNNMVP